MTVPPVPAGPPAPAGPPVPGSTPRPATVTAGGILMFVLGLLALVWGGLILATMALAGDEVVRDQLKEAQRQGQQIPEDQLDTMVSVTKSITYGLGVIVVLFGVAIVVLGFLVLRGSRAARIMSWVATVLFSLCGLCATVGSSAGPTGAAALGAVIPVVVLLVSLAVIVLLALPASNAYFAKPVAQWQPPAEFGTPEPSTEFGTPEPPAAPGAPPAAPGEPAPPAAPGEPEPPAGEQPPERPPHIS